MADDSFDIFSAGLGDMDVRRRSMRQHLSRQNLKLAIGEEVGDFGGMGYAIGHSNRDLSHIEMLQSFPDCKRGCRAKNTGFNSHRVYKLLLVLEGAACPLAARAVPYDKLWFGVG